MTKILYSCILILAATGITKAQNARDTAIYFADPTVFYQDGKYYLFGTDGVNADSGFHVAVSDDLQNWRRIPGDKRALSRGESFGAKGFWAPQIFLHRNNICMAYTANENIAVAESLNPEGPFKQTQFKSLDAPVKQIDPFIFKDDDEKLYLYHVRLQEGNRIFVAELKDDLSGIKPNTLRECINAVNQPQSWENTQNAKWTVTEGPTVIKRGKKYYLFYSANDFRNPDYAVGYAVADNPYGPWKKHEGNPIISKKVAGANGPGHGDLIRDKAGDCYYVFHTHYSNEKVAPRKTAMIKLLFTDNRGGGTWRADPSGFRYLQYTTRSVRTASDRIGLP